MKAGIVSLRTEQLRELMGLPDDVTVQGVRWDLSRQRLMVAVESPRLDVSDVEPGAVAPTLDTQFVCDEHSLYLEVPLNDTPGRCVQ